MAFNAAIGTLSVKISADTSGVKRGIKDTNQQLSKSDKALEKNKKQWASWGTVAKVALAGVAILAARSVIKMSDSFANVQNQIRQTTSSTAELTKRTEDLLQVANRSRSEFAATSELYTQLTLNTEDLGFSTDKLLRITETISKSFSVSGKGAAENSRAIRQLNQAFGRGVLRGDEFISVAEGAPEIFRALKKSLGLTSGELQDFANNGGITTKVLTKAIDELSESIDLKLANSTKTLATSFQEAENNATAFIGSSDLISSAMAGAGESVIFLSENLDSLANVAIAGLVIAFSKLAGATATNIVKNVKLTQSNIALIRTEQLAAIEALKLARAEQAAAVGMFNAATGATKASIANTQLTASNVALSLATKRASAANVAFATSATVAGRAVGLLKSGMALLGGPVGIAIIAAASIATFALSESDAEKETRDFTKSVDDQIKSLENLNKTQKQLTEESLAEVRAKIKILNEDLVEYGKQATFASQSSREMGGGFTTLTGKINETNKEIELLTQKESDLKRLAKAISEAKDGSGKEEEKAVDSGFEKLKEEAANADLKRRIENIQSKKKENEELKKANQERFQDELDTQSEELAAQKKVDEKKLAQKIEAEAKEKGRRILAAEDSLNDFKKQTASRTELENILHQEDLVRAQESFEELKTSKAEQALIIEDLERKHQKTLSQIKKGEEDLKIRIAAENAQKIISAIGVFGKNSLKIQKAVAVASAGVAISEGIALAQGIPFPGNIAEMARIAAVGVSAIRSIKSAKVGSSSTPSGGGSGGGGGGGSQPASPAPAAQQVNRTIDVKFTGQGVMSQDQVRMLIEQFNEALGDGAQLNVVTGG